MTDQDKPAKNLFAIESLVKEVEKERPEDATFTIKGDRFTIQNPNTLYWRELVEAQESGDAEKAIRIYLGDQFEAFDEATKMPNDVLEKFIERINRHFGVETGN